MLRTDNHKTATAVLGINNLEKPRHSKTLNNGLAFRDVTILCVDLFPCFSFQAHPRNTKIALDVVSSNTRGLVFASGTSDLFSFISFISFPKTGVSSDGIN